MILWRYIQHSNGLSRSVNSIRSPSKMKVLIFMCLLSSPLTASDKKSERQLDIWNVELKSVQRQIVEYQEMAAIEGLSVGFVDGDEPPRLISLGYANSETRQAVDDDTIFQAASLSKPILAFIVLKMVERGELDLDRPLTTILKNARIVNKDWAKLITPRLVLSHQTGLPNWGGDSLEFNFKPGTSFNYSGEGYVYLQNVLEKITGLSYQELATREVFKPLNMKNSYFTWSEEQNLKLALGHDRAGRQNVVPIPKANAAASLHTTASDYLSFISAWFNDSHVKQQALREMAFMPATKSSSYKPEIKSITWGLGWGLHSVSDSTIAWHWGDNGIFRGLVLVEPKTQRAMVYFSNSENGLAISEQMTDMFFPGNPDINNWLGYGQADSELWQAERMGYVSASTGDYNDAIEQFNKVLEVYPDNNRLKNVIEWIKPLAENRPSSVEMTPDYVGRVAGQYEDRRLFVEGSQLKYQRGEGQVYLLTPLYDRLFKVGALEFFRLEIVTNRDGVPVKLVGHYEGGGKDETIRTER